MRAIVKSYVDAAVSKKRYVGAIRPAERGVRALQP